MSKRSARAQSEALRDALSRIKERERAWTKKYMGALVGRTIVEAGVNDEGFPTFKLDDGSKCEVSCDAEGNGPGFLFGLPRVKDG